MNKNKGLGWFFLAIGVSLIAFTCFNLYLGRTDFVQQGWLHLGLGIAATIGGYIFLNPSKKNKKK